MSGAVPLLPLWNFGACYRVNFIFLFVNVNDYFLLNRSPNFFVAPGVDNLVNIRDIAVL
jgi:hypothetical protein